MSDEAKVEVTCVVQGAITVQVGMEFAAEEEVIEILQGEEIRSQLAHAITSILEHTYDYTSRAPDDCRIAYHEDGNRDVYVTEVAGASLRVAGMEIHSVRHG